MADLTDKATNAKPSVVKVVSAFQRDGKQFWSTGSGFIVNNEGIL